MIGDIGDALSRAPTQGSADVRSARMSLLAGSVVLAIAIAAATRPPGGVGPHWMGEDALRLAGYAGCTMFTGTVAFWTLVARSVRPGADRLMWLARCGAVLLAISAACGLVWSWTHGSYADRMALSFLVRLAVAIAAGTLLSHLVRKPAMPGLLAVSVAAAITVVAARPEPLSGVTITITTLHVLAASCWLGGLLALAVGYIPLPDSAKLHDVVVRFPRLSIGSVLVMAVTGLIHAWSVAGSWSELMHSPYGMQLLDKIALVGAMLVAGLGSHFYVRGLLGRPKPVQVLGIFVGVELAFGIAALYVTLALTRAAFA